MSDDDASPQRYGRVVIVGGGCYGSYYVRQLLRAIEAGAVEARELLVVDKDPQCAVAREHGSTTPLVRLDRRDWRSFFDDYLSRAAGLFCRHRAYGVGMFDTAEVIAAEASIASPAEVNSAEFVIGTVSHCHGALTRLVIPAPHDET